MNLSRILIGGLVAGLILVIGEYVLNGVVLGAQFNSQREQFGLGEPTALQLAVGAVLTLAYGLILIWIYAAIRPRFGPGPWTAIVAGLTFWSVAHFLFLLSLWANGFVQLNFALISIAWGLVEDPIAALAGAWFYRER